MPVRGAAASPPSHYPRKPTPTTGIDGNRMDAASYLTQVQSRASVRTRSLSNGSSSLISYASTLPQFDLHGRKRSSSDSAGSDDSNESTRSLSWRGLNTSMPLSSAVSATRPVTRAFDVDFVPNPQDPYSLRHSEYGYDIDPAHRTISQYTPGDDLSASEEEPSVLVYLFTYVSYALLILIGHLRDFIGKRLFPREYAHLKPSNGYAPLYSDFDSFYTRRLKLRIEDCFARPITGVAARTATILDRTPSEFFHDFTFTGETTQALNISSYNYLGFAQTRGPCADQAEEMVKTLGVTAAGGRNDVGTSDFHVQAERLVAAFLGTEDAMIVSMGFATNSTSLPALLTKGCLVISDELNHSSIRFGARLSGAMVRQYKHNNMKDLEQLLRECVSQGQPRTHRPWKKIMVIVEGLYSMEGTLVDLPVILQLKEKYKFYLYIDEAHSIGALGPRGRGVCDYFGVDPKRIDILMGTFTKSFGASGGYIAGSHALINALRLTSHSQNYAEAMAPPVLSQIVTSMGSIMGPAALAYVPALAKLPTHLMDGREGQDRLRRLAFNCRYLSGGLKKLGFIVYGHRDSPIVPLLLFSPGKMGSFSRMMLERHKIVVVVVAYPATPLVASRVRFCLSSAHTKEDLDRILRATDEIGGILGLKLSPKGPRMDVEDVIRTGVQMVRDSELEPYRP
ncbi:BZ3500_MvSof-1268-A1-R1_Chr4-2g07088 [Microbotryum saponariae]|uniref:serine C-palmitoyltransferase n=1 Tax=Microbotryum saponariae TaxID=289078 RepID=A0A2X0M419_9BASI|nr:BZ3500_MvSof-1268-A1-R1_Chr4-2g07088 [Microbotryum saponariae]SDA06753.1 BZ3501_MvSof-1269-A2-R1_Chr4-2g06799 [Microbotryum saponariae]